MNLKQQIKPQLSWTWVLLVIYVTGSFMLNCKIYLPKMDSH